MKMFGKLKYKAKSVSTGQTDILATWQNDEISSSDFNVRYGKLKFVEVIDNCYVECYNFKNQSSVKQISLAKCHLYVNGQLIDVPMYLDDEYIGHFGYQDKQEMIEIRKLQQLRGLEIQIEQRQQDYELLTSQQQNYMVLSTNPLSSTLNKMKLKEGLNQIVYEVECSYLGKQQLSCDLYVVPAKNKIFISDIDGTITKSPTISMMLSQMGKDYVHNDICEFYQALHKAGYLIIYMSARSMTQYKSTRKFLKRLLVNNLQLPQGPLILSPMELMQAMKTEMITKQTDILKEVILNKLKILFEKGELRAGAMGDKDNDIKAYSKSGINMERILQINSQSQIKRMNEIGQSIKEIIQKIDQIF